METKWCPRCGDYKPISDFYFHKSGRLAGEPYYDCKDCKRVLSTAWARSHSNIIARREYLKGGRRPMREAKDCSAWLGVHVAEQILSKLFDHMERMRYGFPGYDFVCGKGFKIDCKSACLFIDPKGHAHWYFTIKRNQIPDYFLLLAFNEDRENLTPLHVWLIPGGILNSKVCLSITNSCKGLARFSEYEKPLDDVVGYCDEMKVAPSQI